MVMLLIKDTSFIFITDKVKLASYHYNVTTYILSFFLQLISHSPIMRPFVALQNMKGIPLFYRSWGRKINIIFHLPSKNQPMLPGWQCALIFSKTILNKVTMVQWLLVSVFPLLLFLLKLSFLQGLGGADGENAFLISSLSVSIVIETLILSSNSLNKSIFHSIEWKRRTN